MSSSGVTFLHTLVFALQRCHWGPLYLYCRPLPPQLLAAEMAGCPIAGFVF